MWLLRKRPLERDGRVSRTFAAPVLARVPGLHPGDYRATLWDTAAGAERGQMQVTTNKGGLLPIPIAALGPDLAIAIRPA